MKKKNYPPPRLTVAVFKPERGYVSSALTLGLNWDEGDKNIEERQEGGTWGTEWNY